MNQVPSRVLFVMVMLAIGSAASASTPESHPELAGRLRTGEFGFEKLLVIQRHAIRPSHVYTYHCEGLKPGGGLFVHDLTSGKRKQIVDASQGVLLDADLEADGRTIVFSWKRTMSDPFHIYTIHVDGSGLTALTRGEHHNYNACWLPDGGIAFLSTRVSRFAYCWSSPAGILHRMEADGSWVVQLSANYLNDFTPAVLNDGRIIYARWEYVDRPAIPIQSLWTINTDGTGLRVFYGNRVLSPATLMEPRAIPGSSAVLCVLTSHNGPCCGAIGVIDPAKGVNAQEAIVNLTPEINIGEVDRGNGNNIRGPYQSPMPIGAGHYLVTRAGEIQIRDLAGEHFATVLKPEGEMGWFNALPVRSRRPKPVYETNLPIGEADGTAPVQWATLLLQDVYQGLESHVQRGQIKTVRVVEEIPKPVSVSPNQRLFGFQFPVVSCGATYAPKRVWGEAKVEADGSAYFRVPANRPVYFMALDEEGRALQRMRSFTHLMPGEVQGCIGCHEHRASTPVLHRPTAVLRAPQQLVRPEWAADLAGNGVGNPSGEGFSYPRIVQPVLDRHCVQCHDAKEPAGELDLSGDKTELFNVSYELLARSGTPAENARQSSARNKDFRNRYTSWIPTYNAAEDNILIIEPRAWGSPASLLAEVVRSGHPDEAGKPRINMNAVEKRRIYAWIDLNVPYYPSSASHDIARPGCRMIYPPKLDATLADVAQRRCAACHEGGKLTRAFYTRITNPQHNSFLLAPLAKEAGGTERCGDAVFRSTGDADYQKILKTFEAVQAEVTRAPRWDINPDNVPPPATCPP